MQGVHNGLTGVIKFDEEGYRTDFSVELVQLFEEGFKVIGNWNTSSRLQMFPQPPEAIFMDESQLINRTFVVITTLVRKHKVKVIFNRSNNFRLHLMAC